MTVEREIEGGIKEWMSWAYKGSQRLPLRRYQVFLESDSFITGLNRFAGSNQAVAVADSAGTRVTSYRRASR